LNYLVLYRAIFLWGAPRALAEKRCWRRRCRFSWKHGFANTSLQDLKRATGVNKSGLYTEFRDKKDFGVACLRHYLESQEKRGFITREPLDWKNVEAFPKNGPLNKEKQRGCLSVNSMREFAILPDEAYES
jgi:AcrR family transcriptional regulator